MLKRGEKWGIFTFVFIYVRQMLNYRKTSNVKIPIPMYNLIEQENLCLSLFWWNDNDTIRKTPQRSCMHGEKNLKLCILLMTISWGNEKRRIKLTGLHPASQKRLRKSHDTENCWSQVWERPEKVVWGPTRKIQLRRQSLSARAEQGRMECIITIHHTHGKEVVECTSEMAIWKL